MKNVGWIFDMRETRVHIFMTIIFIFALGLKTIDSLPKPLSVTPITIIILPTILWCLIVIGNNLMRIYKIDKSIRQLRNNYKNY